MNPTNGSQNLSIKVNQASGVENPAKTKKVGDETNIEESYRFTGASSKAFH